MRERERDVPLWVCGTRGTPTASVGLDWRPAGVYSSRSWTGDRVPSPSPPAVPKDRAPTYIR